jgi:hypothetical protein
MGWPRDVSFWGGGGVVFSSAQEKGTFMEIRIIQNVRTAVVSIIPPGGNGGVLSKFNHREYPPESIPKEIEISL